MKALLSLRVFKLLGIQQAQRALQPSTSCAPETLQSVGGPQVTLPHPPPFCLWNNNIISNSNVSIPTRISRLFLTGRNLNFPQTIRWASGGGAKGGESAKEKKLRRMLKKLNPNAAKEKEPEQKDIQGAGGGRTRQEQRRDDNLQKAQELFNDAAAAAQQQMQKHLQHLENKLKELQVARPQLEIFGRIHVHIAGGSKQLAELGQVVIRGTSVARVTLFNEHHLSKVVSALRKTDESWAIVEEGPTTIRVQLPRMSEELRSSFVTKAKAATEECKVQIRRVRQDLRGNLHSLCEQTKRAEGSMKREKEEQLQKLTDEAIKRATNLLNDKLKQLSVPLG